jgi:tetratricopeptide (TPR) repeat protein
VQLRLAELYTSIGQPQEASRAYLNCAHRMFDHSHHSEAVRYADQALKVDATNTGASTLKARILATNGKLDEAIALLEKLSGPAAGGDTAQLLMSFYIQARRTEDAMKLARQGLSSGTVRYIVVYDLCTQLLDSGEADKAMSLLGEIRPAMLEAKEFDKLAQALSTAAERLPGQLEPLEWLVDVCRKANDAFRLPEALDQLADAATAAGQLDRAQQIFEELYAKTPENESVRRKLNQVRARLGLEAVAEETLASKSAPIEIPTPTPAAEEEPIDEETHRFVTQAMTDVDLFSSYGLSQKAIDLLENTLQRAPRHTGVLEKLLDLYLGAGNERRTSELAAQLEQIFVQRGDASRAERFTELRRRFDRAARITEGAEAPPAAAPEFSLGPAPSEPAPAEAAAEADAQPVEESEVNEVDLSAEWAALSQINEEPTPAEVAAEATVPAAEETPAPEVLVQPVEEEAPAEAAQEYELELAPATPQKGTTESFLSELASEVDELELGPAPPKAVAQQAESKVAPPSEETVGQLKEVFDEFRSELGQMGDDEGEDPETHYNLGIAYREMGLLEEAIGEFQKVAKAVESGKPFRYAMQCCTLLALSFMDKGQPTVAVMWYERALKSPDLDPESVMALRYDLGVAQETAGNPDAALQCFTQVYAMNIDYRDVAERIATLQSRS